MKEKRAKEISAFKEAKPQSLPIEKILSTSITYKPRCLPQWVSDTKLSYMSHFDFISYDIDDDKVNLIPKPQEHDVLAVKFCDLVGQNNMRIIYLCKEEVEVENEGNENEKEKINEFSFVVLPSLTLSDEFYCKKVKIANRKIEHIENFSYFPDGQYVVFPVLFDDNTMSIVYMGLATNTLIYYDVLTDGWKAENENQVGSLFHVSATLKSFKNIYEEEEESSELKLFKMSYLSPTKELNEFVLVYGKTMFLLQLFYGEKEFKLLSTCKIDSSVKMGKRINENESFKASENMVTLNLSKTYLVVRQGFSLNLYSIDESIIRPLSSYNTKSCNFTDEITSISASFNSNKLIICTEDKNCMYQFKINESNSTIEYVNFVDLDVEYHEGCTNKVIISDNGRNAAYFMLNELNGSEKNGYVVINFLIFKVELYTELDIPETSLYIKQPKYQNRYKRVNRLVLPKIHEQLYALTGSEVHMLKSHRISGVMFFDVHPCGFYMVICYAFNIKIYSLEFNSMTLLHSTSMQNLKKVLYSPDGSTMVIFSTRKIKVLNSYSFEQNFEITEKANSIMDICFAPKRKTFFTIFDNGIISERSFLDYEKVIIYRVFGNTHHKIVLIRIDERNESLLILLDDGGLIVKNINDFIVDEKCFYYEDEEKISEVYVDMKNHLVFIGTKTGKLRIHDVSIESFNVESFSEVQISDSEITAITTSFLENSVFVGSSNGDITKLRYVPYSEGSIMQRNSRLLKKTREKVSPYLNFEFMLVSAAKFNGNSEQNTLEDKLENLFEKVQHHSNTYKNSLINSYEEQERDLCEHEMQENRLAYRDFDGKSKKIKNDIILVKEKFNKQKKEIVEEYETKIREVFIIQDKLLNEKKELEKKCTQRKRTELTQNEKEKNALTTELHQEAEGNEFFYQKEVFTTELKDLDEEYKINDGAVLESLRKSIDEELTTLKIKCKELNKSNGYLETARQNMKSRRVQEETLEHRISQELNGLAELSEQQKTKIESLSEELKLTEDVIHRIQNKVKNRKNNEVSSDKADNDLCSYKIWMKEKVQEEILELREYLESLETNFDKKSRDMVHVISKIKGTHSVIEEMGMKKEELKQKLKILRDQLVIMKNQNINARKSVESQSLLNYIPDSNEIQNLKIKKIISIEKLNEKATHAARKQVVIHERKLKNLNLNNAELLNEYEKLKFENKWLCDRKKECITDLKKVKENINEENSNRKGFQSERNSLHTRDTPFQKYIKQRASRTKRSMNLNCFEATSSNTNVSSRLSSAVASPMMRTTFKFF